METLEHRPRWVIFDAADTLIFAKPDVASVYQRIASSYDVSISAEVIKERFPVAFARQFTDGIAGEQLDRERWQRVVFEVLDTTESAIFEELWSYFEKPSSWHVFEDVEPTWRWLVERDYNVAIASNFDDRLSGIVAAKPPLNEAKHLFISSTFGYSKPNVEFFRSIERELKIENRKDLLLVGDNQRADFEGALNAGWQALHLDRHAENPDPPTIETLSALKKMLNTQS